MESVDTSSLVIGSATGITQPATNAVLNVEEYASSQPNQAITGFPKSSGQSLSYWLQQVRCDPLLDHRTTEELPKEAATVIIGSGITGTLVAKNHLETWPDKKIVVLEAREFCSGATGRNAGHCKPDQWRGFGKHERSVGPEQAVKILRHEQETWEALVSYVEENKVDCDLWIGDTFDVPLDEEVAELARDVFSRYQEAGGRTDHIKVTQNPEEAVKITRISGAKACYAWPASTLQPWKLTAHIMRSNIQKGLNLQTNTLATSVSKASFGSHKWTVYTDRGSIVCDTVVHATNAYIAAIEPSLKALQNSYGVLLSDGALFSINPRCTADGAIMFGGSNPGQKELDKWIEQHPEDSINDGFARLESVTKHVREFVERDFPGWEDAQFGEGEGFDYSWSGIIGLSGDGVPFVGELPGKPGQWICAGHHGHGMARIFTAAPGLVKLMNGESWATTNLPDVYQLTPERLHKLKGGKPGPKIAVI